MEPGCSGVLRADRFIKELGEFEKSGRFPDLVIICLPNDHTSGTKEGMPTPEAHVADNDLAFGRIVEAISHSRFWKETCIFAIEDDPQDGWDHVSSFRTTAYVISPYTRRGAVVGTQYNQPGILRTIELILGLPPMNQMDAAATPLFDCFQDKPDFTPYDAVPNNIPLDRLNPPARAGRTVVCEVCGVVGDAAVGRSGPVPGRSSQQDPVACTERAGRSLSGMGNDAELRRGQMRDSEFPF